RYYKPVTAGRRGGAGSDLAEITDPREKPEKSLPEPKPQKGGGNKQGVNCTPLPGGGPKRPHPGTDLTRRTRGRAASVVAIEYDPNRSARIALVQYEDGEKAYILAPEGLKAGDKVYNGEESEPRVGNCMPLRRVPLGMTVHNVEMQPGRGGQLCRS